MDIEIVDEPTLAVAVRRATLPMDQLRGFFDSAFGAVAAAVGSSDGQIAGPALSWHARMPAETVELAGGFPVSGLAPGPLADGVEVIEIAGGRAAMATYVGPYEGLGAAWETVIGWAAARSETRRGDLTEIYLTQPVPGGDPAANETCLVLPLA
ncbi:GyrI-like domain-containing protein [Cellulomonas sp. PhB143]|uniref:GyrI-like domain-containing protein n=1 Tax=Cellulomonas sp. PhB143 TaxID=2485186 RepID=UPI000F4ADDB6|nr:GyrI-like domain-containing protein [Cellulomonas sp. PhB143]ROS75421.1 effector-binding domain-containing protein [Cellulomonas sp. PhB143]